MGQAAQLSPHSAFSFDDFDDDFEDDLEEEEMYSTPLDKIDEYIAFADALQAASGGDPSLLCHLGLAQVSKNP